jgi:hypothetical protein
MIRAKDVLAEQEEHRANRMTAMQPIMTQLERKIRQQAIHAPNSPYLVYEVPSFVFGHPLYDMKDACEFLRDELIKAGFWAWITENKYLVISWVKGVNTRDGSKQMTATNYRPSVY